jgi:O6-methylguanine-DNA--protein-cysteine methyltransferase
MIEKIELKLGDSLYKYSSINLLIYTVFGIVQREEGKYYQVRCTSCNHGNKCEVLIKEDDRGKLVYVSMLNEDEEDKQYYWHMTDQNSSYELTKKAALTNVINRNIEYNNNKIKELQDQIKTWENETTRHREYLKGLEEV